MAIDSQGRWGPATAAALKAYSSANFPPDRLTFVTDSELTEIWKIITGEAQTEVNGHADIMLDAADIPIDPGTFMEQLPTTGPIIGVGVNQAVTLEMKIK